MPPCQHRLSLETIDLIVGATRDFNVLGWHLTVEHLSDEGCWELQVLKALGGMVPLRLSVRVADREVSDTLGTEIVVFQRLLRQLARESQMAETATRVQYIVGGTATIDVAALAPLPYAPSSPRTYEKGKLVNA